MSEETSHRPSTIAEGGSRIWIYPQDVNGLYSKIRVMVAIPLLLLFYVLPWSSWNGFPLLRLSLGERAFFFLGQPILIQEFYHFAFLFLLALLVLFLMSALWGRVWCGYGCPQTIFIEQVLRRIERWIEGPAASRKINDSKKRTPKQLAKKILKQFVFFLVSLSFGLTAVSYFAAPQIVFSFSSGAATVMVVLLTSMAWFDGAYWREQFCHLVCPYARLQSVMISKASKTIGYDSQRGEPRRKGKNREGAGDCIDCGFCVRVCPSGIDIRQGINQLECVACARCIDACDSIMASIEKPKGLIRYDSELNFENKDRGVTFWSNFKRPRVLFLFVLCVTLFVSGLYGFIVRKEFHVQVLSVPGVPFVLEGDKIKNIYTLKIGNQSRTEQSFVVTLKNSKFAKIESPHELGLVPAGDERFFPLLITLDSSTQEKEITIEVQTSDGKIAATTQRLILRPEVTAP